MVCKPNNAILYKAIYKIVENVNSGYYGLNSLSPTGPLLLKTYFSQYNIDNFKLTLKVDKNRQLSIYNKKERVMTSYPDYKTEQLKSETIPHYGVLWAQRRIYTKGGFC